jgi:hypothetical protein
MHPTNVDGRDENTDEVEQGVNFPKAKSDEFEDYLDRNEHKICTKDYVSELNSTLGRNDHQKFIHQMCIKVFGKKALSEQSLTGRRKNKPASEETKLNVKHLAYIRKQLIIRLKKHNFSKEQVDSIADDRNFRQSISKVTKLYSKE